MHSLKSILFALGIAPLLCLLLAIPMFGLLHASASALFGFVLFAGLILLQWPVFRLIRRYLPVRDPE